MKFIQLDIQDVYFNLAAEEYTFFHLDDAEIYFLIWQNRNAVVVGKHQNPIEEINFNFVESNDVQVARRLSGGGAVYHDLGNLNYSIIAKSEYAQWDIKNMAEPIVNALRASGVDIQLNKRNDLLIDGKKISGSAQYIKGKRLLHHGTLLFQSDLEKLSEALRVRNDTISSRSIKSVRSEVTNICDHLPSLTIPVFISNLLNVLNEDSTVEEYEWTHQDRDAIAVLREEKYSRWDWIYGRSPEYSIRKERQVNGEWLDISLVVKNGIIQALQLDGDHIGVRSLGEIEGSLVGVRMIEGEIYEALSSLDFSQYSVGISPESLARMIVD
jgi:lipoate-protein ligase A